MSDIPYRFEPDRTAASLHAEFDALPAGEETGVTVTVAGRLMLRRLQGKVAFGTLQDWTGRVQLFCPAGVTERFDEFCDLRLGDWIGATVIPALIAVGAAWWVSGRLVRWVVQERTPLT